MLPFHIHQTLTTVAVLQCMLKCSVGTLVLWAFRKIAVLFEMDSDAFRTLTWRRNEKDGCLAIPNYWKDWLSHSPYTSLVWQKGMRTSSREAHVIASLTCKLIQRTDNWNGTHPTCYLAVRWLGVVLNSTCCTNCEVCSFWPGRVRWNFEAHFYALRILSDTNCKKESWSHFTANE